MVVFYDRTTPSNKENKYKNCAAAVRLDIGNISAYRKTTTILCLGIGKYMSAADRVWYFIKGGHPIIKFSSTKIVQRQ